MQRSRGGNRVEQPSTQAPDNPSSARAAVQTSRRRCLQAIGALSLPAAPWATAQEAPWPNRPIRLVPFGTAGGPIDIIARLYGERLTQRFGQQVLVDAKPGASGIVAADFVAKAPPDGHTLLFTLSLTHTTVPMLQQRVPYDSLRDFQPITQVASGGPMLVVPTANPATNLKEFVAWAKAKGRVTYGTWGNGSAAHLWGELLKRTSGAPLDHVPYKGEAAAHLDMFSGTLDCAWANPATARNQTNGGKLRALGITGGKRVSALPNVATFAEQGFEGFMLNSWIGLLGPAKLPAAVTDKLQVAFREFTQTPEVRSKLQDMGFETMSSTPDEMAASMRGEQAAWAALIKAAGVVPE
jgi:tripartite-type tricarboxylate transporter receptor subunit TctC